MLKIVSVLAGIKPDRTGQLAPDVGSVDNVASFGEDALGNLYVIDFDGEIFRLAGDTSTDGGKENLGSGKGSMKAIDAVFISLDQ